MADRLRIGSRGSKLARWQSDYIAGRLQAEGYQTEIVIINTRGDQILDKSLPSIGGKGVFTEELERALLDGDIDCAVHSLKDLPTQDTPGLTVGAIPERANVADVLVGHTLDALPDGAVIGTSSRRRAAQLLYKRPDLTIKDIRGNVPTRIDKVHRGDYDATLLARAGVERLELTKHISQELPLEIMLNAPGQGALGIQCRVDDTATFAALNHHPTRLAALAERAFLAALGGGCAVPVAALASLDGDTLSLHGRVNAVDGSKQIDVRGTVAVTSDADVHQLGQQLATMALEQGAEAILAEVLS